MPRKKKTQDFKKIKLKAGKRLPKHLNETKPEVKAKRIQINSSIESIDLLKLLSNPLINTNRKLVYLTKFNQKCLQDNSSLQDGEQIQIICKYLTDNDYRVRFEVIKCLRAYFKKIKNNTNNSLGTKFSPTLTVILTFLICGITHINKNISRDSEKLLTFIIDQCDSSMDAQLMQLFLMKIDSSLLNSLDSKYYSLLKKFIITISKRRNNSTPINSEIVIKPQELVWNPDDYNVLYLNRYQTLDQKFSASEFNLTFQQLSQLNINETFMRKVENMAVKDIKSLIGKGNSRFLSVPESIKAINALEIISALDRHEELLHYWNNKQMIPFVTLELTYRNNEKNQKFNKSLLETQNYINRLLNRYKKLM